MICKESVNGWSNAWIWSSPFASLAMTSVHARRARNAYRKERTSSAQSAPNPAQPPIIYYEVSKSTI